MSRTLIVIPTYNEAENIRPLFQFIWQNLQSAHILVVDDHSKDQTQREVEQFIEKHPEKVHLMKRSGKLGLGTAYIAGFKWGLERGYESIIEMDADLSHDAKLLPSLVKNLESYPVVIGSRYVKGGGTENWSWLRLAISKFGSFYARTILGMRVRDLTGGFNAWRREVLLAIDLDSVKSEGYSFQIELKYRAYRLGYEILELPFIFKERTSGQSKMSSKIILEAMYRVWLLRNRTLKSSKI